MNLTIYKGVQIEVTVDGHFHADDLWYDTLKALTNKLDARTRAEVKKLHIEVFVGDQMRRNIITSHNLDEKTAWCSDKGKREMLRDYDSAWLVTPENSAIAAQITDIDKQRKSLFEQRHELVSKLTHKLDLKQPDMGIGHA